MNDVHVRYKNMVRFWRTLHRFLGVDEWSPEAWVVVKEVTGRCPGAIGMMSNCSGWESSALSRAGCVFGIVATIVAVIVIYKATRALVIAMSVSLIPYPKHSP